MNIFKKLIGIVDSIFNDNYISNLSALSGPTKEEHEK